MKELEKIPPHSIEAEQAVLGSCMLNNDVIYLVYEILKHPSYFYNQRHRKIYNAILKLMQKGVNPDLLTVSDELRKRNEIDTDLPKYLVSLLDTMPTTSNVIFYSNIIKDKALHRELITASHAINELGWEESKQGNELLERAESIITKISESNIKSDFSSVKDLIPEVSQEISDLYHNKNNLTGLSTGYSQIDSMINGLKPTDVMIIAARPSMGKTALALNIALNVAENKNPVAFFNLEMSKTQILKRLLSIKGNINHSNVNTGKLSSVQWEHLTRTFNEIYDLPLNIDDTANISILEIKSKLHRLHRKTPLKLVVIDYLQLISNSSNNYKLRTRDNEVSDISRSLKGIAKEFNVPVIALSQLSRKVEDRFIKKPKLSDLRDSGSIEQDADTVLLLFRESYYQEDQEEKSPKTEIIIAKNRNGETGTVVLDFYGQYLKFQE